MLEKIASQRREALVAACRRAVECLEGFTQKARRELDRADKLSSEDLALLPSQILAAGAWGTANATTELSGAFKMVADYLQSVAELEPLN